MSRSGSESLVGFVTDRFSGRVLGSSRRVSVIQAMRSRTQRTEPAMALITSEDIVSLVRSRDRDTKYLDRLGASSFHYPDQVFSCLQP